MLCRIAEVCRAKMKNRTLKLTRRKERSGEEHVDEIPYDKRIVLNKVLKKEIL